MTDSNQAPALLETDGAIATITLNRPAAYNAIDIEMAQTLERLALQVEAQAEIRVLVLRAAGKAFCAGGDIRLFVEHLDNLTAPITELLQHLNGFVSTLRRMPQLVITSVQGPAAGAGFSLAFMGDFCVAAEGARFTPAYAQIGISPDAGGSIGVVRALGPRRALQLFLTEPEISSQRAEALGLVTQVAPDEQLAAATLALAQRLAAINPIAAAHTKQLVWQASDIPISARLAAEASGVLSCMQTEAFKLQVRKFAAR